MINKESGSFRFLVLEGKAKSMICNAEALIKKGKYESKCYLFSFLVILVFMKGAVLTSMETAGLSKKVQHR